jgi:hypothetical protein
MARIRQHLLQKPPQLENSEHFVGMGIMLEEVHRRYEELKNEKLQSDQKRKPLEGLSEVTISNNLTLLELKNTCDADSLAWKGRWDEFSVVFEDPKDGIPKNYNPGKISTRRFSYQKFLLPSNGRKK